MVIDRHHKGIERELRAGCSQTAGVRRWLGTTDWFEGPGTPGNVQLHILKPVSAGPKSTIAGWRRSGAGTEKVAGRRRLQHQVRAGAVPNRGQTGPGLYGQCFLLGKQQEKRFSDQP